MTPPLLPAIAVDPHNPSPPYEQIRAQVAEWIAAGWLGPGAVLPSVRQLAGDLGVAPNTVVRAYDLLAQNGWIIAIARKGYVVGNAPPALTPAERTFRLNRAVRDLITHMRRLGITSGEILDELTRQLSSEL